MTKKAITLLENAADHIYRHVQVNDETGIVTPDAQASADLKHIITVARRA